MILLLIHNSTSETPTQRHQRRTPPSSWHVVVTVVAPYLSNMNSFGAILAAIRMPLYSRLLNPISRFCVGVYVWTHYSRTNWHTATTHAQTSIQSLTLYFSNTETVILCYIMFGLFWNVLHLTRICRLISKLTWLMLQLTYSISNYNVIYFQTSIYKWRMSKTIQLNFHPMIIRY